MSAADAFVGELLSWAPRRLIPQTALAFAITILLYPSVPTSTNRFLVILPLFIFFFGLWSQFGYRLRSIFEGRSDEINTSDFMRTESFITGILEGERSFAEDVVGSGVNTRRAVIFIASAIAGEVGFYGLIITLMFALNRIYLVLSGFDVLAKLGTDGVSIAAFAVIVALAVSFLLQVRKMEFQGGDGGSKQTPNEDTTFAMNLLRRYMVDNTVTLARQASPLLRGFLPLISIPTIVEPFAMDNVLGLYRPDEFKKTIEQAKKEELIIPLDKGAYDALMQVHEDGSGLPDISVISGEELLHASFPGTGQVALKPSKCSFKLKTGVGFLNIAAFKACYQGWEPRTAFRTPKIRRTTVFYVFGMGNEPLIAKLKTRFKLKLVVMANQAIPCEE